MGGALLSYEFMTPLIAYAQAVRRAICPVRQAPLAAPLPLPALMAQVQQNEAVPLPHLSLIEVGGIQLMLLVNSAAVQRVMRRTAALVL